MMKRVLVWAVMLLFQTSSGSSLAAEKGAARATGPQTARAVVQPAARGHRRQAPRPARKIVAQAVTPPAPPVVELESPPVARDAASLLRMARWMLERGNPARAYVEATGVLVRDADVAEAYFLRGCAALDLGMTTEATLDLESAVILAPDYGQAFEQLGFALLLAGDAKKASDAFARASQLMDEREAARVRTAEPQADRAERGEPSGPFSKQPEDDLAGADLQAAGPADSPHL